MGGVVDQPDHKMVNLDWTDHFLTEFRMVKNREQVKARLRFLYACDGIKLTEAKLEQLADWAEEDSGVENDPALLRAQARAKAEGRSVAEMFLEEAKR